MTQTNLTFGQLVSCITVNTTDEIGVSNFNGSPVNYIQIIPTSPVNCKKMFEEMLSSYRKYMIENVDNYPTFEYVNQMEINTFKVCMTCIRSLGDKKYLEMVASFYKRPFYKPVFCSPYFGDTICDIYDMHIGKRTTFTRSYLG